MQPLQYDLRLSAAKDISITHAAAAARNLDATMPLRSADTDLQSKLAQREQRREKVTWRAQLQCARRSRQIRRQSDDARARHAIDPTVLRNRTSVYPKKTPCFVSLRSNPNIQIASSIYQFQCDLPTMTCKNRNTQRKSTSFLLFSSLIYCTPFYSSLLLLSSTLLYTRQEHANCTGISFQLLLYFMFMPTGRAGLELLLYFRYMPTRYFST